MNFCSDSVIECFKFYEKCRSRLGEAGFNLRKFESNSVELDKLTNETNIQSQNITKVLSLTWDKKLDLFIFSFSELFKIAVPFPTKRDVLSFTASFFDPLGLINPVIVRLKILFQQICVSKIGWDCKINKNLLKVWQDIYKDLSSVQSICVPRSYFFSKSSANCTRFELYGFSDASLKAFGCCIYLRCIFNENEQCSSLVTSKSRIASLSKCTIPRLELKGCLLLATLMSKLLKELSSIILISKIKLISDSYICLHWIPKVRNLILKIIKKCFLCRRYEGKTYSYPDGPPLPSSRVNDDYVFKYTGIDYCGPLFGKNIYSEGEIFKDTFSFLC